MCLLKELVRATGPRHPPGSTGARATGRGWGVHREGQGQTRPLLGLGQLLLMRDSGRWGPTRSLQLSCAPGHLGELQRLLSERVFKVIKN